MVADKKGPINDLTATLKQWADRAEASDAEALSLEGQAKAKRDEALQARQVVFQYEAAIAKLGGK